MFTKARLKLTLWYISIIMVVSLAFSTTIYTMVNREFNRRFIAIENRLRLYPLYEKQAPSHKPYFLQEIVEARHQLIVILLYTNGIILVFTSAASYFLAGKTLRPIEEAMVEQKRFVADASHELRTPLTALITTTEVTLRDKKLKLAEAKEVLRENLDEIKRLSRLANQLLTLASHEQAKKLTKQKLDLSKTITAAISKLQPEIKSKKQQIIYAPKKITLSADYDELVKLFTIFLDNAHKYSDKNKKITISTKAQKKHVDISIKDQGVGISLNDIGRIFERFYRADSSRCKTTTNGFGLGLAIARDIVNRHGGEIKVKSKLGHGTTFSIKLPYK